MATFDEKAAIEQSGIGQDILWSHSSLRMDEVAFDALFGRLEVLEALGQIRIVDFGHESYTGRRLFVRVKFQRVQ